MVVLVSFAVVAVVLVVLLAAIVRALGASMCRFFGGVLSSYLLRACSVVAPSVPECDPYPDPTETRVRPDPDPSQPRPPYTPPTKARQGEPEPTPRAARTTHSGKPLRAACAMGLYGGVDALRLSAWVCGHSGGYAPSGVS